MHSDPFQTNHRRTICLDIMVLAYLLLHPRAGCSKSYQLNSYSQNELESGKSGIEGEMETREERERGRVEMAGLGRGGRERRASEHLPERGAGF